MDVPKLEDLTDAIIKLLQPQDQKYKDAALEILDLAVRSRFTETSELEGFISNCLKYRSNLIQLVDLIIILCKSDAGQFHPSRQILNLTTDFRTPIQNQILLYKTHNLNSHIFIQPGIEISAPKHEFIQCIVNLADNACKFSPLGGLILVTLSGLGNGGCILTVIDQGEGIAPGNQNKAFERNILIPNNYPQQLIGLGLGLPVVRSVAEHLGGEAVIMNSSRGCGVLMTIPSQ